MWTSVPQMPVRSTLTSTSLGPTSGTGTSLSHSPFSRLSFTRAFIIFIDTSPSSSPRRLIPHVGHDQEKNGILGAGVFDGVRDVGRVVGRVAAPQIFRITP